MTEEKTEITKPSNFELLDLKKKPCLIVMSGKDLARKYTISTSEVIIGRSSDANIVIKEHNISRRHAKIIVKGNKVIIEDLGSTNGTFVNSEKIKSKVLKDADLISVGKTILKFSFQSDIDSAFHDEIYNSATNDELTTLFNRKYLQKHIESEFARAERYGRDLSLLMLDIDDFKLVNDKYGHPAGDYVLKSVGKTIKGCVRHNVDIPARYGGEEFAVLLPETGANFALKIAEKIRQKISELQLVYEGTSIDVSVSIGISSNNAATNSIEDLIRRADEKLYVAKRNGKNRVEGSII